VYGIKVHDETDDRRRAAVMSSSLRFEIIDKPTIWISTSLQHIYGDVDARVALHDHMNAVKNPSHYFSVGASAVSIIQAGLDFVRLPQPHSILDFACGAGRVTRWLKAAFPNSVIVGCDLRDSDLHFQSEVLGVTTWKSSASFQMLKPPRQFDLIWVGSLLSHLSEKDARSAMNAFMSWLNPKGLLVVSFHGRRVKLGKSMRGANYISEAKFQKVQREYDEAGFGYENYDNQEGLGFTLIKPQWFFDFAAQTVEWKVVGVFEAAWDDHHDICIIANTPVCVSK
jgi:2-polyprenyl-3-methyl-5-hydroxy-6-metoxy-1,4-benzoquinol methylase